MIARGHAVFARYSSSAEVVVAVVYQVYVFDIAVVFLDRPADIEIDARGEIAFAFVFHGRVAFVIAVDCFDPCVNC